jgi:hypothetical protein
MMKNMVRQVIQALILVLIGIVTGSVLVGGIVKIREAAARIQCANNFRQIGLSMTNYCDAYEGRFPLAAVPNPNLRPEDRLSWFVEILPFVESNTIYTEMNKQKSWDCEENHFAALLRQKIFQCPATSNRQPVSACSRTDYVGISGIGANAADLPQDDTGAGLFGFARSLTVRDIKNGASMLIAAMETSEVCGSWTAAGAQTVRGLDPCGPRYLGVGGQFGGKHRGGANVMRAEGSVRCSMKPSIRECWRHW